MNRKQIAALFAVLCFSLCFAAVGFAKGGAAAGKVKPAGVGRVSGTVTAIDKNKVTIVDSTGAIVSKTISNTTVGANVVKGVVGIAIGDAVDINGSNIKLAAPVPAAAP